MKEGIYMSIHIVVLYIDEASETPRVAREFRAGSEALV